MTYHSVKIVQIIKHRSFWFAKSSLLRSVNVTEQNWLTSFVYSLGLGLVFFFIRNQISCLGSFQFPKLQQLVSVLNVRNSVLLQTQNYWPYGKTVVAIYFCLCISVGLSYPSSISLESRSLLSGFGQSLFHIIRAKVILYQINKPAYMIEKQDHRVDFMLTLQYLMSLQRSDSLL